jgi:hypothetical protein
MFALIPKIFYADKKVGLDLFVDGLGFQVLHQDGGLAVIEREGAKAYIVEDAAFAAKDRPEFMIETDRIEAIHADIAKRRPDLLHPGLPKPTLQPWGATEFAVRDSTTVCVVIKQW